MQTIDLGPLEKGPHADHMRAIGGRCATDERILAAWVGGSLATGRGDVFSDIDFRIAVQPDTVDDWVTPDWGRYLPLPPSGGTFMRFGEHALLHHLVLSDSTILDFYVQDTTGQNFEPNIVILFCGDRPFGERLAHFSRPVTPLVKEINGAEVRQFLVDYWITTHKQMKALARKYDLSPFVGLYWERLALLRGWYMQATGKDIKGRATLHMLDALHKGLEGKLTESQQRFLGLPSRSPEETVVAIEGIRAEMARVGRWLAEKHQFEYPHEIEAVVQTTWDLHKGAILRR